MSFIVGKHDFDGKCNPYSDEFRNFYQETFSVGCFQWIPKSSGKGLKRSAVKVRVVGPYRNPALVYDKAKEIIEALDNGTYTGPRTVTVDNIDRKKGSMMRWKLPMLKRKDWHDSP